MPPNEIVKTIINYGMCGLIVAYFCYKDYKFTSEQLTLTGKVVSLLERIDRILPGGDDNDS